MGIVLSRCYQKFLRILGFLYLKNKGVEVEWPGPRIDALPRISSVKRGSIRIGRRCILFSGNSANPAGVMHRTTLVALTPDARIVLEDGVQISGALICAVGSVVLESQVMLGANVCIYDTDFHPTDYAGRMSQKSILDARHANVSIKRGCWIGANATILKGVTVGERSVIGACSVVTKNIASDCIAAGNPCAVVRSMQKNC